MARKNARIRKADSEVEMTPEQVQEFRKCFKDPIYFIKTYIKVQHPKLGSIPLDLYPYQENMIHSFMDNRYSIVLSARQTGKALSIQTPIATPSGFKPMGELQVGDFVINGSGVPTRVKWVSEIQHDRPCYELTLSTGETIVADEDHQWVVSRKGKSTEQTLTTRDIVDRGGYDTQSKVPQYSIQLMSPLQLPDIQLPTAPYAVGELIGSGKTHAAMTSDELYAINAYTRASHQQRLAVIQGLMDRIGGVFRGATCVVVIVDPLLVPTVVEFLASVGLKPHANETSSGTVITFNAYRDSHPIFQDSTKLSSMLESKSDHNTPAADERVIVSIKPTASVPVKCIGVESDCHTYVVGHSFIKTHNSTVSAIYLLWYAMFSKDKTILIASNKNKGAMEMIQRIRFAYEELPMWLKPGVKEDLWNKHACGFDNGSRIESTATTESSGRGMSISLLFLDEFAFVKPLVQEEFWTSILPTLSTGGSCIMSSTPNGDTNLFAQLWRAALHKKGSTDIPFVPIHVKWDEPPGRDSKFKAQQIKLLGLQKWNQEYECQFLSSDTLLIDSAFLLTMASEEPIREQREFQFWSPIYRDNAYIVTVDPATGTGGDFSVIDVFHFPSLEQVAQMRTNDMSSPLLYSRLKWVLKGLENKGCEVYFTVENNGVGEGIIALYQADEFAPQDAMFVGDDGKRDGMSTQGRSKMKACMATKELVEARRIVLKSAQTILELKTFIRRAGSYQAQTGATDDCVSTVLLLSRVLHEISAYEEDAFDAMYRVDDEGEVYHISDFESRAATDFDLL